MSNQNELYSYNGIEPTFLPHRITLSDGTSRTDNTTFTAEEIENAGFTGPYEIPEYNHTTQKLIWNSETLSYSIEDLPSQEPTEEDLWFEMRRKRNFLLFDSDWSILPDSPLSDEKKEEWKLYRESLRNLPQNITDILSFTWPISPNESVTSEE